MLGKGHAILLRRAELKTFVDFHGNEVCWDSSVLPLYMFMPFLIAYWCFLWLGWKGRRFDT